MENVTHVTETITPDVAREYLKFNINNRPVRQSAVNRYAEEMKRGTFQLNGETIIFSDGGVLMQGQHRLMACVKANVSFQSIVVRGVNYDAFHTIDQGCTRTESDVFSIYGVKESAITASIVSAYMRLQVGVDVAANVYSLGRSGIAKKDLLDVYLNSQELFDKIRLSTRRMYSKVRLLKISTIGCIMAYLVLNKKHSYETVEQFFDYLHFGIGHGYSSINILRDKLINDFTSSRKMSEKHKIMLVAKAWNAYLRRLPVKQLSWNEAKEKNVVFL